MNSSTAGVASACRRVDGGIEIDVWVQPNASSDRLVGLHGDAIKVRVAAPPEKGRANEAVCALVATALGIRAADVRVVRGDTARRKVVRAEGITLQTAVSRIGAALGA